jgi:CubicO group peptidase (beta-lactamase class C family)
MITYLAVPSRLTRAMIALRSGSLLKSIASVASTSGIVALLCSAGVAAAAQPASQSGGPVKLQPDALVAATRARIEAEAKADRFSGAVLIAKDGKPILVAAYGMADRHRRKPNTPNTQFRIGSTGKLFTTVSVLQLAQAGKLDLGAPIGRYLPDYSNQDIATKATVGNLLSHTGGTGDFFGPEFVAHRDQLRNPKDYIALFGSRPPVFEPRSKREYSNYGFMILGRIVEVVSGLPYDRYVAANIFAPAGMTASGFQPESLKLKSRAVAYTEIRGRVQPVTQDSLAEYRAIYGAGYMEYRGGPAGGGYSTVEDLLKFSNALTTGTLLSAEYRQILTMGRVTMLDGSLAGYDYGGRLPDGRRFIGHAGGATGQCANVRHYLNSGYTIIVLENRDPPGCFETFDFIGDRIP